MKKIKYPERGSTDFINLVNAYKAIYTDLSQKEVDWAQWKSDYHVTTIPETVEQLLEADVDLIADVYDRFTKLPIPAKMPNPTGGKDVDSTEFKRLKAIFNYTNKYDDKIAGFFEEHAETLHISTCHYCEMAYVNAYTLAYPRTQPAATKYEYRRQFDVDHYMPKAICPIIALSLFNFVPSCQVCNSRIKLTNVLGTNTMEWEKFNPAGKDYSIDDNVKIRLRMWRRPDTKFRKTGNYYIYFRCKNGFRTAVEFFHLEERYEFHKVEAMRLRELKAKYPQSTINRLAKFLGKKASDVKEDIFHERFLSEKDRCFAKLARDILS